MMKDHELRLALVLNGGVSLAVWMGGVLHELDLLRRASAESSGEPAGYDKQVFDRWRAKCGHRRITVDVVAGSSAGGLNGAMLATAIARGGTLDPAGSGDQPWLRTQWEDLGAMVAGKLLPERSADVESLLDGGYFSDQLHAVLETLAEQDKDDEGGRVTLFVTATGVGSHEYTVRDAAGAEFTVADHRFVYRFDDFTDVGPLAEACRASAALPGAFAPQIESEKLAKLRVRPAWASEEGAALIDGGVIDNAPFGPLLDEIVRRPIEGQFDRYVLYLVPSAGMGQAEETQAGLAATIAAAVRYPQEADFRSDVEDLERLLAEADASWSDTQLLFNRCVSDPDEAGRVRQAATLLMPAYTRARAAGGVWDAMIAARKGRTTSLEAARALTEDDIDVILGERPVWVADLDAGTPMPFAEGDDACWPWGVAAAERVAQSVARSLHERPEMTADEDLLSVLNEVLPRIRSIRDRGAELLAPESIGSGDPAESRKEAREAQLKRYVKEVNQALRTLDVPETLGSLMKQLAEKLPDQELTTAMAVEVVSRVTAARMPMQRSAPFRFLRLGPDIALPIFDKQPDGKESIRERIEHLPADGVLFGTQLWRLGSFGATEWRSWDWLIGRLHGVAHLGRMLGADDDWIRETQEKVLEAERYRDAKVDATVDQLVRIHDATGNHWRALRTIAAELNRTGDGGAALPGLINRVLDLAPRFTPAADWLQTVLAADEADARAGDQTTLPRRLARWFSDQARIAGWNIVEPKPERPRTKPPWLLSWWAALGCLLLALGLVAIALVTSRWMLPLGIGAGAGLTAAFGIGRTRRWLEGKRVDIRDKVSSRFDPG